MRHGKKFNHLSRKSQHRKAMLSNMATSLILNKRIFTTTAKAKALRKYVEPLITKSKDDTTNSRRVVFSYLQDKHSVNELFNDVAARVATRPGGYTRIIKTGTRLGDNAEMCMIELVDYNEMYGSEAKTTKTRRSRRSGGSKKAESETTSTEAKVETPAVKEEKKDADTKNNKVEAKEEKTATDEVDEVKEEKPKAEKKEEDLPTGQAGKKDESATDDKEEEK